MGSTVLVMVGVGSPISKSQSLARLHSPSQVMARKLVRKYSLGSRTHSLGHRKRASDLDLVLEVIKYIEQLQQKVVCMSQTKQEENVNMFTDQTTNSESSSL